MRARWVFGACVVVSLAVVPACTCAKSSPTPAESGDGAVTVVRAMPGDAMEPARFSAPIAATRIAGGVVLVAGLVVPRATIAITRIEAGGQTSFTVDALRDVKWSQDAELRLFPAGEGAVLVWRGLRDGKSVRQMVMIGPRGEVKGAPAEIGAAACVTEDGIAWTERAPAGATRARTRTWANPAPHDVAVVSSERDPLLVCAAHRVFVLGEGENDITLAGASSEGGAPLTMMRAQDFGEDDSRDHGEYTVGDDLGFVRVASSGALAMRELHGDALGPWRKLTSMIARDDDVVGADGDLRSAIVVYTREESESCAGDPPSGVSATQYSGVGASSVHAVRIDRATNAESVLDIAPAECNRDVGPFWTGGAGNKLVVAWAERVPKRDDTSAPIAGLAYRLLDGATLLPITRIARPADAIVDAGCDKEHCYVVALVRAPGTDEMLPEVAQVIRYP